jgi:excinuclease ABC subunit A
LPMVAQTVSEMVDSVRALPEGTAVMLLAPVVRDRKGEHTLLFEQLQSQGFVRARVDGELIELEEIPVLDKKKKHTIEVVVDRFKVRDDLGNRLAESFETALRLGSDIAMLSWIDDSQPEQIFSAKHSCPQCDRAVAELEPRLFSFNNPYGACPVCDGLGVRSHFSSDKLIPNPALSLNEGAIRGWDRQRLYYFGILGKVAAHFSIDMDTAWHALDKTKQNYILNGSGKEKIDFSYVDERGRRHSRVQAFEGVLPYLERRYKETESNLVRDDLAQYLSNAACDACGGSRLNEISRHVKVANCTLPEITKMAIGEAEQYYQQLTLEGAKGEIGEKIFKEIRERLHFLVSVGLNYLSLSRSADTLSGGEAQRIRLASQIGAGLMGVMYVLDEPSIGLHQRDNERLLGTLIRLRDLGNTVLVVEHDEDAIRAADHIIDIGPGAGIHGGQIIAEGTADDIRNNPNSLTGQYLSGALKIAVPTTRHPFDADKQLKLIGASGHNLRDVNLNIPLGLLTCVTGVSGSGKSTLINRTLLPLAATQLNGATTLTAEKFDSIDGLQHLDKVVDIDQSPIGRTPRSNPATYTGLFTPIRELFAQTPEAKARGYAAGRFSFNVKGGRCESCEGDGMIKVAMHFLPDMYVPCDSCEGKRYNRETLEVSYKGRNINDVLTMTVEDAAVFFESIPVIHRKLETLMQVGLGYIRLGQAATTLSGGEAQRVKLARELAKRDTGKTLYILDEPTTGLHFHDIAKLLEILHHLRDKGNTIVVIEHNLDVVKTADWVIDLGPEGGSGGGMIIAEGTPEHIVTVKESFTGSFLKGLLC